MYWFFMKMMSAPTFRAWLPLSQESESSSSYWFVCWNFGRKSGEPETAEARALEEGVDLDPGEAARDQRVGDAARDDGGARHGRAEGLLDRVRGSLLPVEAQLVDDRRAEDARPAQHHAVALDRLVAEGRRPRPVEDAPEGAGDVALAVRVDVAREDVVVLAGVDVEPSERAVLVVGDVGDAEEVVRPAWFGSGTRARMAADEGRIG
jgi:hypothetical protein